jgi:post-segregation antitoxin (ccd killing protein)
MVQAYIMRMPRMQVYLPEDLYREVKRRRLPVSELLQQAVRTELDRERKREELDRYLEALIAEVGEPGPEAVAEADAMVERILRHQRQEAS